MALTPLQEIFVLLEDEKEVPLFRLNRWGKQARGVIGKLPIAAILMSSWFVFIICLSLRHISLPGIPFIAL